MFDVRSSGYAVRGKKARAPIAAVTKIGNKPALDQPLGSQADVPFACNNHMIMKEDAEQSTRFGNPLGDLDIGSARLW